MNPRVLRQGVIALAVAAAVAGASTVVALATIPDSGGVIHGCYQKNVGNLRVIDTAIESCRPSEIAISWSQTGPAGPQGPQGLQGVQGPTGGSGLSRAYFVLSDPVKAYPTGLTALPDGYYTVSATVNISFPSCTLCIGAPLAQCTLLSGGSQPFADGLIFVNAGDIFGGTLFAQASFTEAIHLTKGTAVNSIYIRCSSDRDGTSGRAWITALAVDALN